MKIIRTNARVGSGCIENTDILYTDLLALINNNKLVPNTSYRITNYTTTTVQTDTQSAGNNFDIIVTALSTNKLSEVASCVRKAGDTYFANAKLEAWEIKYCINNDTTRFGWASTSNGKGVIYYMKDEWGNECHYDFKNIKFKKLGVFLYTFGGTTDDSLTGACRHNIIMTFYYSSTLRLSYNTFGTGCDSNTLGNGCSYNTLGNICKYNNFGYDSTYNNFGNNCTNNTFVANCSYNTFGMSCSYNTLGNSCNSNTFGMGCSSSTFGTSCIANTFGNYCSSTFVSNCTYNTFGNYCSSTFGNSCSHNNFYAGTSGTIAKTYIQNIILEDGCSYNNFYSDITTSYTSYLKRIRIKGLENTSATNIQINVPSTNTKYEWLICYTSSNTLKQYCPNN